MPSSDNAFSESLDRGNRALILAAFLAPGAVAVAEGLCIILRGSDRSAMVYISMLLGLLWIGLASGRAPLRRFLGDLGAWLVSRVPFVLFVLFMLLALLNATILPFDGAWASLALSAVLLSLASARKALATNPRRFFGVLFLLGVNGVLLLGCDLLVRLFVLPGKSHNSIFIVHDPHLGWKLRPGYSVERDTGAYASRETINALGFRTPLVPFEKPEGVKRIVILGDSHTEAYTVSDGETYGERLEACLSERFPVQVIALGVGGYSTDQELLAYLNYGRKYDPDLVLLQFCPNDVEFNVLDRYWRGLKPRFERCGDFLILKGVPVPDTLRLGFSRHFLLKHSAIALVLDASLSRFGVTHDVEIQDLEEAWRVTELLLRDLHGMVRGDGALFFVFNANPDSGEVNARLRKILDGFEIPFIDIKPAFQGDIASHRVPEDRHWNRKGHDVVSRFLAGKLAPHLTGGEPRGD